MRYDLENPGYSNVATLDIETTSADAHDGETVSIGLGLHERGEPATSASYELLYRQAEDDESELIRDAFDWLNTCGADGLVSYNGRGFDLDFLADRMALLGETYEPPALEGRDDHLDLFEFRQKQCSRTGEKWPKLEECLAAYDLPTPRTVWNGVPVTNSHFGDVLGPSYLDAIANENTHRIEELRKVIDHYLLTDLEANFALYHLDTGAHFDPALLNQAATFEV